MFNAGFVSVLSFGLAVVLLTGYTALGAVVGLGVALLVWMLGTRWKASIALLLAGTAANVGLHVQKGWAFDSGMFVPASFNAWAGGWQANGVDWQLLAANAGTAGLLLAVLMIQRPMCYVAAESTPSAKPEQKPERLNAPKSERVDATVIGKGSYGRDVVVSDASANTHTLVVGTTGSGKTVTVLNYVESFISRGLPVLYVDGKGDKALGQRIIDFANANGNGGHLFSMIGDSEGYNPLKSGTPTAKRDRLIELREWSEPHYRKLAEGYLQCVFRVLDACQISVNLVDVADYLKVDALKTLIHASLQGGVLDDAKATKLAKEVLEQAEAQKHVEGLAADIRNLARSDFEHLFTGEGIVLGEALAAGKAVYMGLNPLQYAGTSDLLGKLIINDFKATLDPSNSRKILVVLDEFGVFAGDQVMNVINQGRSAGVCAVLTVQSVADIGVNIEHNADLFIERVFSNCNNYLIHRVNSAVNADQLATIVGTNLSHQLTAQLGGNGETGRGSVRMTREFKFHPEQIKTLTTGQAIYLDRNTGAEPTLMQARKGVIA